MEDEGEGGEVVDRHGGHGAPPLHHLPAIPGRIGPLLEELEGLEEPGAHLEEVVAGLLLEEEGL